MGSWFSKLFGRKEADAPAAAPAAPPKSAPSAAAPPAAPSLSRDELVEALQLTLPAQPPALADPALAAQVLEEFRRTRPVPASPPALAMRILNLISTPDPDPAELAKLVSLEPALTAGVLRVASSAAYRGVDKIENLRDAITRLGTREVANVCAALSTKSVFGSQRRNEESLYGNAFRDLFVHATATALASASLAFSLKKVRTKSDVVFLCALLHDIGMSVGLSVLARLPTETPRVLKPDELQTLLDAVHVEIGGEIHREWKLPETALQICLGHHLHTVDPAAAPAPASDSINELHVVRLTSALRLLQSFPATDARLAEVQESAQFLGLNKFALRSFDGDVRRFTATARTLGT